MTEKISSKDGRVRNWTTIVYPDSAPENWKEILSEFCVPCFVSPLHDKDVNPTGELKKPHYHVVIMFEGKKSIAQVQEIFDAINGVGCMVVHSIRSIARYLCHLDNPDKFQYDTNEVFSISADYIGTIGLALDKYVALGEMVDFCEQYDIMSFYALVKYAHNKRPDWHRILCDCGAVYMREYLKSRKWSVEMDLTRIIDPVTGEVIQE